MKWIDDPTRRFPKRPYFTEEEINFECEKILADFSRSTGSPNLTMPISTDELIRLIESEAKDLDLYANLEHTEGPGVEGVTEFRPGERPLVKIEQTLSGDEGRINRLRSTLAHEFFHVKFHQALWQLLWVGKRRAASKMNGAACHRSTIINAQKVDWLEWQAAYGAGAFLVPKTHLMTEWSELSAGLANPVGLVSQVEAVITKVAQRYQVSTEAATVRLKQLGMVPRTGAAVTRKA
jgi:hypothetical protein